MQLGNDLRTVELGSLTITKYFDKINRTTDLLANIDSSIKEKNLVTYAINGLSDKYEGVAGIIRHRDPPPTFAQTQSMLLLEESRLERKTNRQSARDSSASCAFIATNNSSRRVMHKVTISPTRPLKMSYSPEPSTIPHPIQPTPIWTSPPPEYHPTTTPVGSRGVLGPAPGKGDLYPVLPPTSSPTALLSTNESTWHQRLGHPGMKCFKSLYGLKQASHAWFQRFFSYAIRVGFIHNKTDSSLFVYQQGTKTAYLLLYVDAISLYMVSKDQTNQPISLFERFPMISNSSRVAYIAPATTINPVISNSSRVADTHPVSSTNMSYASVVGEVIAANTWEDDSSPQGYEDKGNLRQEFKTSGGFVEENNWDGKWDHPWESDEDPQVNPTTDDFPLNQDYKANGMEENKWGGEWEQPWGSDVNAQAKTTTNHTDFLQENTWEESQPVSATTDKVELIETKESESNLQSQGIAIVVNYQDYLLSTPSLADQLMWWGSMFEISGNNFNDWFLQLKMVLRVERKLFVIEQPISLASPTDSEYLRSGMRMRENQLAHMSLDEELCGTGMSWLCAPTRA
ncbi:hybrid signal transduction histidine kinase M [Tanacetum coccineum]